MSRSVWSAPGLPALSCGKGGRKREQAPRTPYASRPRTPKLNDVAERLECARLAGAVVRQGRSKAGASSTHSIRFATKNAKAERCRGAFGVRPACRRCRAAREVESGSKLHALHTLRDQERQS